MSLPLNDIYQKIGESIAAAIEDDWVYAEVLVEIKPDVRTFEGYYISEEGGKHKGFRLSQITKTLLKNLHTQMAETPQGNWKRATFSLHRTGKFDLAFEY